MRTTRDTLLGEAAEECGVPGGGPVGGPAWAGKLSGGSEGPVCGRLPRKGGYQGLWQTGWRRGGAAQTP
jgi:hypothetical protein